MTEDLATLGIKVDASEVTPAATKLDGLTKAGEGAARATDFLKESVRALGLALGAAEFGRLIKDSVELAVRFDVLGVAMRVVGNNAGYTLAQMQAFSKQIEGNNYSAVASRDILVKLAAAHIDLSKASQLSSAAQGLAAISGRTSAEAFDTLTSSILSGRAIQLRQMGLAVDFITAQERLASKLHITTQELTENQKIQANLNAVMEHASELTDVYKSTIGTASGQIRVLGDEWEDLKTELGKAFLPTVTTDVHLLAEAVREMNDFMTRNKDTAAQWGAAIKGAIAGAVAGSFVPGVGTLLGGALGATLGALNERFKTQPSIDQSALMSQAVAQSNANAATEAAAIALAKKRQATADAADAEVKHEAATKEAAQKALEFAQSLQKEADGLRMGELAAKDYEIGIQAAKAPTAELREEILKLGAAFDLAFNNKKINDSLNDTIKNLDALITSTNNVNYKPLEILSVASINDPNGPHAQGTGDKLQPKFDTDAFNLKAAQAYLSILSDVDRQTQTAAASMAAAFGNVGRAIGGLSSVMSSYAKAQQEIEIKRQADIKETGNAETANAAARQANAQLDLQYDADLLGSAKQFFSQKSLIYKTLTAAEDAYRLIQLATAAQQIITDATTTASGVAAAGTQASAWGVTAFARTLASLPFPWNLAAGVAVLGALAAVGVAISGGSGNSENPADLPDARQKLSGAGSVLGDSGAAAGTQLAAQFGVGYGGTQSASISKSLEDAQKYQNQLLDYTNKMVQSLRAIENNIGYLTNAVAREISVPGGALSGANLGLGTTHKSGANIFEDILGGGVPIFPVSSNTTKSLQDFGLTFQSQTLGSIANGILGNIYDQILTSSSTNVLGIKVSSSKSNSTIYNPLTDDISTQVQAVIGSLKTGVLTAAGQLGVQGAQATIDSFKVSLGTISFQGLTSQQIQDELNAVFSKLGDQLATAIIPDLVKFQQAGEGAMQTLVRLADEYNAVDTALTSMGKTFDLVGLSSIAARDNLVQLAGGLDNFTNQAQFFVQNMLSSAQQLSPVVEAVAKEMANLGESGVTTKEQFAALVQSIDVSTQSGAQLYTALMNVAPAFAKVADAVQQYTKASTDIFNTLVTIAGKTPENQLAIARQAFSTGLQAALGGDVSALGNLPQLAQSFAGASLAGASSATSYNRDIAGIKAGLNQALQVSDTLAGAKSYQDLMLKAQQDAVAEAKDTATILQSQTAYLAAIATNTASQTAAAAQASAATAATATVTTQPTVAQTATMTPMEAALSLGPINGIGKGHNTSIMDIQAAILAGIPISDASYAKAGIPRIPGFASGGRHTGGWRIVGENGPELEKTGPSQIVSNSDTAKMLDNSDVVAQLQELRKEFAKVAKSNKKLQDILVRITRDGDALLVKAA